MSMEQIINDLLSSDNSTIKRGTANLQEALKSPEAVANLCEIVVNGQEPQHRQYSAVLLKRHLGKLRIWKTIPIEQQNAIKTGMLTALFKESEKSVRNSIATFVGVLVRHEAQNTGSWMNELLQYIYQKCSSADPNESELGSSIFNTLTDVAPDQFIPHMQFVCEMFTSALMSTEASGNMASPVMLNIIIGMNHLVPFVLGHNTAEATYQKSILLIIKALKAFAVHPDVQTFVNAFEILESMADYTPKLLSQNIKPLTEFSLELANNLQLNSAVRVRTVAYIGLLVRLKKKAIIKHKLLEPILYVIFNLMAAEPENDTEIEDYFLGEEATNPMTTATQTMDLIALNLPPEKLLPPLLQLLEPALQGSNVLQRRAAFLCMAVIAEGCSETICNKYLENMLSIVKVGIMDSTPMVRNAAFFTLGQFAEYLQPEISKYAPQILPTMFDFLRQLCNELRNGLDTEPQYIDRLFYALDRFTENMQKALVPHLPELMEIMFEILNQRNSSHIRELALNLISGAANATKEEMLPYFQQIIAILQPYFVKTQDEDILELRSQAMDTLATIARTIGKENFMPLAIDTMNLALELLEAADDPDDRRGIYNIISALAEVVNEEMEPIFPKIMERIFESILRTDEVVTDYPNKSNNLLGPNPQTELEIDIEHSDEEDTEDDSSTEYNVENDYMDEKEEAISTLKEFAEHTGVAFIPYLEKSYQNVYKMIDHPNEDIRKISIDALCTFVVALKKTNDKVGVLNAVNVLIPKMCTIIHEDEEMSVVMTTLENLSELLNELEAESLPNVELQNAVFNVIKDVLTGKLACQFEEHNAGDDDDDAGESEFDEAIIEEAGNMFPLLGGAIVPEQFNSYFTIIYPILLEKLNKAQKSDDYESQRSFVYGALAECFKSMRNYIGTYFNNIFPVLLRGVNDEYDQCRQNAIYGLGELVLYAQQASYGSFPILLSSLSEAIAKETKPSIVDNICGAIGRLILTNYDLVPLEQVLPVFVSKLPLQEDFAETLTVFQSIQLLLTQKPDSLNGCIEEILSAAIHVLYKEEYEDEDVVKVGLALIKELHAKYPENFNNVANSNSDIATFLQTL